jgi:hypothetical protein
MAELTVKGRGKLFLHKKTEETSREQSNDYTVPGVIAPGPGLDGILSFSPGLRSSQASKDT